MDHVSIDSLKFKCYNPSKPNKWHIKIFEVSDARTGYVVCVSLQFPMVNCFSQITKIWVLFNYNFKIVFTDQ